MKPDTKSMLAVTACVGILGVAGALSWRTLQGVPVAASPETIPDSPAPVISKPGRKNIPKPVTPLAEVESAPEAVPEHVPLTPAPASKIKIKDRLTVVTARCDAAEEAYAKIKDDSSQLGQIPHSSITQAWSKMRLALDSARRELERGELDEAREDLDMAELAASKVIRAAGGN
ncbi:MAG: hypothetical protein ACKV2U_03275 [Bryobacteraceae bacterium]